MDNTKQIKVLMIDDDELIARTTSEYFNIVGVKTAYVTSYDEAIMFLEKQEVSLLLLDINLGDKSGFELCKKVRESYDMPIFFISARTSDDDILIALNIGGDDYIKKPFSVMELISRVKALLRRTTDDETKELVLDDLIINNEKRTVSISGNNIELTYKEYELLSLLVSNKGIVLKRAVIMDHVWGTDFEGESRTIDMHVKTLRQKLGTYGNRIRTVRNVGYVIE